MVESIVKKERMKLVKSATTFKLNIPSEVEAKIRHLCSRVHEVEWSGTLFYKVQGSLEDNSLIATCIDIFVMDIGTSAYTEYNESPDVIAYMCQHPELLEEGVFEGLIHSHNNMATFFSGTDTNTLIEEGTNTNHFLSLIVNNAGKYTAGITRKITEEIEANAHITCTKNVHYNSFGNSKVILADNAKSESNKKETKTIEYIEWFEAEIDKAEVSNSFEEVDLRLSEIKASKERSNINSKLYNFNTPNYYSNRATLNDRVATSYTITTPSKNSTESSKSEKYKQLDLFDNGVVEESLCNIEHFDKGLIKTIAIQLLTGSIIINTNNIDIDHWVQTMDEVYERKFGPLGFDGKSNYDIISNLERLETWIDLLIEFLVYTKDENLLKKLNEESNNPTSNFDEVDTAEVCAYDLYCLLNELPKSNVKDIIMERLKLYIPNDILVY